MGAGSASKASPSMPQKTQTPPSPKVDQNSRSYASSTPDSVFSVVIPGYPKMYYPESYGPSIPMGGLRWAGPEAPYAACFKGLASLLRTLKLSGRSADDAAMAITHHRVSTKRYLLITNGTEVTLSVLGVGAGAVGRRFGLPAAEKLGVAATILFAVSVPGLLSVGVRTYARLGRGLRRG